MDRNLLDTDERNIRHGKNQREDADQSPHRSDRADQPSEVSTKGVQRGLANAEHTGAVCCAAGFCPRLCPLWVDAVEKVSAKKLWNWNLKRWNPGNQIFESRLRSSL